MGFKKEWSIILVILILIVNVLAVEVVQVQQSQQPKEKVSHWYDIFLSGWFWLIIIVIIILFALGFLIFFVVRWFLRFLKSRTDIFFRMKQEKMSMAILQSRYRSPHWYRISKNIPIRLVKLVNNRPMISEPIGYHRGDYTSNEGVVAIALNLVGDNQYFIFPRKSLLIIPNRENIKVSKKIKDKIVIETIENLPRADQIVQYNPNEILLYAESLSTISYFKFPVLRSKDGKIIDLSVPVYASLKEVALNEILYEQTSDFGILSKQASNINPFVRTQVKVNDSNSNVDVPQGNQ